MTIELSRPAPPASPMRPPVARRTIGKVGLRLPRRLSYASWEDLGRQLAQVASSSAWCLGDWLIHGESAFAGRYRDAIERTSLDYQTLRNYAWVARNFAYDRRRPNLSFGHHAEVAALPEVEQDYWLAKAVCLGWSRNTLRRNVHAGADADGLPDKDSPRATSSIRLPATALQLSLCEKAAARVGMTLEDWALSVLEREAKDAAADGVVDELTAGARQ